MCRQMIPLGLTPRSYMSLRRNGVTTVEELETMDRREIACIRGVGKMSLDEIFGKLQEYREHSSTMVSF